MYREIKHVSRIIYARAVGIGLQFVRGALGEVLDEVLREVLGEVFG